MSKPKDVIKRMLFDHKNHEIEVTENPTQDVYEVTCSCGDNLNIKRTTVSEFFELNAEYFMLSSIYDEEV